MKEAWRFAGGIAAQLARVRAWIILLPIAWITHSATAQITYPESWRVRDTTDQITGETSFEAFRRLGLDNRGSTVEITATCPSIGVAFKFTYLSGFDKTLGYKLVPGNFLLQQPHVVMRLAIDGKAFSAPSPNSDFRNVAVLWFQRTMSKDELKGIGNVVFAGLAQLTSPATPETLFQAKLLKVELPLGDGQLPVIEIKPQEANFPEFASRCEKLLEAVRTAPPPDVIARRNASDQQWGPPSVFDSYENLWQKARMRGDEALVKFLSGKVPVPGVWDTPGQRAESPRMPGDIIDSKVDWDATETQTVYVRYSDNPSGGKAEKIAQVLLEPSAFAALKERRGALLAVGVSATRSKKEPDPPPSTFPPDWSTRQWFACPAQYGPNSSTRLVSAQPAAPGRPVSIMEIRSATPVEIVGKRAVTGHTEFEVRLEGHADQTYRAASWELHLSCSTGPVHTASIPSNATPAPSRPPVSASTESGSERLSGAGKMPDGLAELTIHSGFPGEPNPLARTRFYLMADDFVTTLSKVGIRVPTGPDPSAAFRDVCRGESRCLNNLVRASTDHAAALAVSDANGDAKLAVQPGEYYIRIYGFDSSKRHLIWNEKINLTSGANSFIAGPENAKRLP
jgi:hypothetical protein